MTLQNSTSFSPGNCIRAVAQSMFINHPPLNKAPKLLHNLLLTITIPHRPYSQVFPMVHHNLVLPSPRITINNHTSSLFPNHPSSTDIPRPDPSLPVDINRPLCNS